MAKRLAVIIPYYNETPEQLQFAVHSIAMQMGTDFSKLEVVMVNDCNPETVVDESFTNRWPMLDMKLLQTDHNAGCGVARQVGIDNTDAEYVMFLDADDRYHNVEYLSAVCRVIRQGRYDIIMAPFYSDACGTDYYNWITHGGLGCWMHNKIYRRQFLVDNELRFHPDLKVHEDGYFNTITYACSDRTTIIKNVGVVWCNNPNSTVRRNNSEFFTGEMHTFMRAQCLAIEWLKEHHKAYQGTVCDVVIHAYVFLHQRLMEVEPEKVKLCEGIVADSLAQYWDEAIEAPDVNLPTYWGDSLTGYQQAYWKSGEMVSESFPQWLEWLGMKVPTLPDVRLLLDKVSTT